MSTYRYHLEKKGQKKISCPHCRKPKVFVRYIDTKDNTLLPDHVGRCDREINCGYHFTPSQYFDQNPSARDSSDWEPAPYVPKPKIDIPTELMTKSLSGHESNSFITYLNTLFPPKVVASLCDTYNIGSTKHYNGTGCVFWFVNKAGQVRAGQVKKFDPSGHTATFTTTGGETRKCTNHVHEILKKAILSRGEPLPVWLTQYIEQDLRIDCFYGEHLLSLPGNESKPIAIVEAPKTAIVASAFFPEFVWLAIGALSYLKRERCGVLFGRNVTLFPDLNAADAWKARIENEGLNSIGNFSLSTYLEDTAPEADKVKGFDLCDYLEKIDYREYLQAEIINTLADPNFMGDPDSVVMEFGRRGLTATDYKANVLPVLIEKHNYTAV